MSYVLCIFEDKKVGNFCPLVLTRPVYDLRCGISTLWEKTLKGLSEDGGINKGSIHFFCRSYLVPIVAQRMGVSRVNQLKELKKNSVLFINGRLLFFKEEKISLEGKEEIIIQGNDIVYARLSKATLRKLSFSSPEKIEQSLNQAKQMVKVKQIKSSAAKRENGFNLLEYPWDLVRQNGEAIRADFELERKSGVKGTLKEGVYLINPGQVYVGEGTLIEPGVLLNAEKGPIYVDGEVTIRPPTVIDGPSYIGKGTVIDGAKIREGCSIGPACRIAGEIEESIFYAYSNKHHDGFVGHSYVGEWVNLAALTTTSDLKNTYGQIKVRLQEKEINTFETKVGSFIADHSKTGIGTLLDAGCVIGVSCNVFGGDIPPKHIPSFSWGGKDGLTENSLRKAIEVAKLVMQHRKAKQTQVDRNLLKKVYELTAAERKGKLGGKKK